MRKMFFVLFVVSMVAVGFFVSTMSADNKAYARLSTNPDNGSVECFDTATGAPCLTNPTITLDQAEYEGLLKELETYKALEGFWAMEALKSASCPNCSTGWGTNMIR